MHKSEREQYAQDLWTFAYETLDPIWGGEEAGKTSAQISKAAEIILDEDHPAHARLLALIDTERLGAEDLAIKARHKQPPYRGRKLIIENLPALIAGCYFQLSEIEIEIKCTSGDRYYHGIIMDSLIIPRILAAFNNPQNSPEAPEKIPPQAEATYSGNWKTDAHSIKGMEGTHYELAQWVQSKGFEVEADPDSLDRSYIARPGGEDFGNRIIGEIVGDSEAKISISAKID
jgi:hypothetical protein